MTWTDRTLGKKKEPRESTKELLERLRKEEEARRAEEEAKLEVIRESMDESRAARETEREGRRAEKQAEIEKAREKRHAELKAHCKRSWLAEGGLEKDFEEAWPAMEREILAERTLGRQRQASSRLRSIWGQS